MRENCNAYYEGKHLLNKGELIMKKIIITIIAIIAIAGVSGLALSSNDTVEHTAYSSVQSMEDICEITLK
jgi:NADH:ubiquinone oxidoreductase subunit 4 (subunit M)